ncbi:hypothetical protein ACA910_001469 [Epithemia clementina (nom. ined.)]
MQALEHDKELDEDMVTSPVTYTPSPYELLRDTKIKINNKYLESLGLEKAALDLNETSNAKQSKKENQTVGKKSSLVNAEDAAVMPPKHTRPEQKM